MVEEVKKCLRRIDIDAILESGYIEQLIEDAPTSIFPTIGNTEKPDVLAAKLLEGRPGQETLVLSGVVSSILKFLCQSTTGGCNC